MQVNLKNLSFKFLRNKGFSLMQMMVGIGVIGIGSVGLMQIIKLQTKSSKSQEVRFDMYQSISEVIHILAEPNACFNTFKNIPTLDTATPISNTPTSIKFPSDIESRFKENTTLPSGLKISSFKINYDQKLLIDTNWYMVPVSMILEPPKSSMRTTSVERIFYIRMEADPSNSNNLKSCMSSGLSNQMHALDTSTCTNNQSGKTRFNGIEKLLEYCDGEGNWIKLQQSQRPFIIDSSKIRSVEAGPSGPNFVAVASCDPDTEVLLDGVCQCHASSTWAAGVATVGTSYQCACLANHSYTPARAYCYPK